MKKKINIKKKKIKKYNFKKKYSLVKSIKIIKYCNNTKFDSSIDMYINIKLNKKKKDILIFKKNLNLPYSNGKKKKILALVYKEDRKKIKKLGVKYVGGYKYINKIKNEKWLNFDLIVTNKFYMNELVKLGKILGSKGLIPNIDEGNITENPYKIIKNIILGKKIIIKPDKYGIIHTTVGKVSYEDKKIIDNIKFILKQIKKIKINNKNLLLKNVFLSSTMGPSVKLSL
ncbi:MAG: 50S ribosomal protein L1 [Candidatus Shikimatogenerans bostrichidophilus]|nr:MAG: 50S ribosomal protein L1 [Candidatus Shikimatogenerans bostrichidophilus]